MAPNQHERYTNAMTTWGSGHGLFHPPSDINDQAKPGVCGYIDDSGIWQAIIDLTDESALNAAGLSKPGFALLKPPSTEIWGPRYTDTVKGDTISGEAALAAGIPAEFSTALSYSAQSDFAAVLLCSDPVRLAMYPHKAPFRKWAKDNAKKLLQMCGDVATHGFYVMTSTWSAQDVWINAWTNKDNSVTIGVKGSVPQVGAVGGSVQYHRGGSAGGWHQPETVGDERRVVFFGGVYFRFNKLFRRFTEVKQPGWAGYLGDDEEGKFVVEDGNDVYEVESSDI